MENNGLKRVGGFIQFGVYPQDTDTPEPINWDIIAVENGEALLVSNKILDAKRFDEKSNVYETSEIRFWLNTDFINKAFSMDEQKMIINSNISTPVYKSRFFGYKKVGDSITTDKIFLLSEPEVSNIKYFRNEYERQKIGTKYALNNGLFMDRYSDYSWWWLRSPCMFYAERGTNIREDGIPDRLGANKVGSKVFGVVPALRIKVEDLPK